MKARILVPDGSGCSARRADRDRYAGIRTKANWKTIVPQSTDKLEASSVVNNIFLLSYLKDARNEVRCTSLKGKSRARRGLAGNRNGDRFRRETKRL